MEEGKQKINKIVNHIPLLVCPYCDCYKQLLRDIDYYSNGQVILNLFCEVCGSEATFNLFNEGSLPQIKIETDVRHLALRKIQTKRLSDKKKEKIRQVIK